VTGLRRLVFDHRMLTAWLIGCALLMKILVPAGFMPVMTNGVMRIAICGGSVAADPAPAAMPMSKMMHAPMSAAMPGMTHDQDKPDHQGREMPCAFSGLSMASIAAADPLLLAIALAFVVTLGFRAVPAMARAVPAHLRPPLRGPPVLI